MDWQDVEAKLQARVDEVCLRLLPNGRREGAEWVCGNLDGQPGRSLKVNLGGKLGYWRDFAGDKGGKTLMSLWCTVRSQPFKVCIREAKEFLGLRDDFEKRVVQYQRSEVRGQRSEGQQTEESAWRGVAEVWAKCQPLTRGGPVWKYLVEQRRLEECVLEWYGVREFISQNRWVMVFPYFFQETEAAERLLEASVVPAWLKFECLDRPGGKKREWTSRAPEKCLWGTQVAELTAFKEASDVLICEGEKDALSWASYGCGLWGIVPVSVPFGAKWKGQDKGRPSPNREWLDRNWEWLQGFESVYVAMDSDEAGHKAAADIISEIGPRRCRLVSLPEKLNHRGTEAQR